MPKKNYPKRRTFTVASILQGKLGAECFEEIKAKLEALAKANT